MYIATCGCTHVHNCQFFATETFHWIQPYDFFKGIAESLNRRNSYHQWMLDEAKGLRITRGISFQVNEVLSQCYSAGPLMMQVYTNMATVKRTCTENDVTYKNCCTFLFCFSRLSGVAIGCHLYLWSITLVPVCSTTDSYEGRRTARPLSSGGIVLLLHVSLLRVQVTCKLVISWVNLRVKWHWRHSVSF